MTQRKIPYLDNGKTSADKPFTKFWKSQKREPEKQRGWTFIIQYTYAKKVCQTYQRFLRRVIF
jgi:hypothetical protein